MVENHRQTDLTAGRLGAVNRSGSFHQRIGMGLKCCEGKAVKPVWTVLPRSDRGQLVHLYLSGTAYNPLGILQTN